jgi:hypothetical protein
MTTTPVLVCSECGDEAIEKPPRFWATCEPTPRFSHADGEALCAVMTRDGYRPAEPIPTTPGRQS